MKNVFVCAGMELGNSKNIKSEAIKLGELLAKANCTYIQGGSTSGIMGLTLKSFLKHSNNVRFFIPEAYYDVDAPLLKKLLGNNFVAEKTKNEAERLIKIKQCDEIIVLPGGTGTLEELLYCNETLRATEHSNNLTLVNVDGFFNNFLEQLKATVEMGFTKPSAIKFAVKNSVDEIEFLN